jgi:hypothetical protein
MIATSWEKSVKPLLMVEDAILCLGNICSLFEFWKTMEYLLTVEVIQNSNKTWSGKHV